MIFTNVFHENCARKESTQVFSVHVRELKKVFPESSISAKALMKGTSKIVDGYIQVLMSFNLQFTQFLPKVVTHVSWVTKINK